MSILEDLWYGNLSPNERTIQKNSEYARLSKESLQCEEQFIKDLSAEGRQAYEDHTTKQMALKLSKMTLRQLQEKPKETAERISNIQAVMRI